MSAPDRRKGLSLVRLTAENAFDDDRRALHFVDLHGPSRPPVSRYETLQLLRAIESAAVAARRLGAGEASGPEREELARAVQRGARAKSALVEASLGEAWWYARLRSRPLRLYRGELDDLMQEGVVGLLEAVDALGSGAGELFGAYARHWMQDAVRSASGGRALPRRPGAPRSGRAGRDAASARVPT